MQMCLCVWVSGSGRALPESEAILYHRASTLARRFLVLLIRFPLSVFLLGLCFSFCRDGGFLLIYRDFFLITSIFLLSFSFFLL